MAQFDVYENLNPDTCPTVPFLLDVQAEVLESLATRVVVPLIRVSVMGTPARHLNPEFEIGNVGVVMSTAELAGVSARLLGPKVASLNARRDEIMDALDFLLTGF